MKNIYKTIGVFFSISILTRILIIYIPSIEIWVPYFFFLVRICFIFYTIYLINYFKINLKNLFENKILVTIISAVFIYYSIDWVNEAITEKHAIISIPAHVFFFVRQMNVGIFEELFFRVLVFTIILRKQDNNPEYSHKLLQKPIAKATLWSSLLFGLVHLINIGFESVPVVLSVCNQVISAIGIGILFQAILLRTKNIAFVALIHGLVDYLGGYNSKMLQITTDVSQYGYKEALITFLVISLANFIILIPLSMIIATPILQKQDWKWE
ncbi:CAAX protease self-immunity [Flexibacter flexilis DSM 6793]|uniref:CAAX protease self-immunity n=1 Tax=Flexibacter flexilis DSM 6793 TaxID=927664 RepID=A0A1I1DUT9_9BACT|nr:CPBP family intramembrane glutamic endopeptidase [Flexibacter flexilis]SFB76333.1 CAAX protease self-immunity [Flexibacter flexilis DSM 6793]